MLPITFTTNPIYSIREIIHVRESEKISISHKQHMQNVKHISELRLHGNKIQHMFAKLSPTMIMLCKRF